MSILFRVLTLALAVALATPAFAAPAPSRHAGDGRPFVVVDLPAGTSERDLADPGVRRALVDQALAKAAGADVVILVRDAGGAFVRPDAVRRAHGGTANTLHFTFESPDHPWTPDEVATLEQWLADFLPVAIEVYGPPAFDLTVNVRKDPSASTAWYSSAWNEIGLRGALHQETLVCHEMIHAFHDDDVIAIAAWEEGMTEAATQAVFARLEAYHSSGERHGAQSSIYELLNRPPLAAPYGSFGWNPRRVLRYQMSDYAWTKPLLENPDFFRSFNAMLYEASASRTGVWAPEDELALRQMARAARSTVEGLDFDSWYDRQHVLDLRTPAPGEPALYMASANSSGSSWVAEFHVFQRDVNETPLGDVEIDVRAYDHAGSLAGTAIARTDGQGGVLVPVEVPAYSGYTGRMRVVATARTPLGDVVAECHWAFGPQYGVHGVVVGADDGEVTAVRTSDGLTATSPVVNGVFSTPPLNEVAGTLVVTWRHADGRTDVRTITKDRAPYYVAFGVGENPTTPPLLETVWTLPFGASAAIAPLNVDGREQPDLAIVTGGSVRVCIGDGLNHWPSTLILEVDARDVAAGDLDHDGYQDLVVANDHGGVEVLRSNGRGGYLEPVYYPVSSCCSDRLWLSDLDRDGHLDVVVANTDDLHLSVLRGDGRGRLGALTTVTLAGYADHVAIADFDRDGHLDLAANNSHERWIELFRGDGRGAFSIAGHWDLPSLVTTGMGAGDLDRDGWTDLAIGLEVQQPPDGFGSLRTSLLLNDRNGGFTRVDLAADVGALLALADLDGDGHPDLITRGPGGLGVHLGAAGTRFVKEREYAVPPGRVAVGDLDGDAITDLAVSGWTGTSVLLNRSSRPVRNRVQDPSFESGIVGWDPYHGSRVDRSPMAHTGSFGLRVRGDEAEQFGINDHPNWARDLAAGSLVRFGAWVRAAGFPSPARLRVREYLEEVRVGGSNYSYTLVLRDSWQYLEIDYRVRRAGSALDLQVIVDPTQDEVAFDVDDVSVEVVDEAGSAAPVDRGASIAARGGGERGGSFTARVTPNPSHGEAMLAIVTTRSGALKATLHDLAGRRVRTLIDEPWATAGSRAVAVRDGASKRLAPGLYFFEVEAAEGRTSGRFVIIE